MKLKKILAALLLVAMVFSCVGVTACAETTAETAPNSAISVNDAVAPQYLYDYNEWIRLDITGTYAEYSAGCFAGTGIEKIQIGLTLEKFWGLFIWTRKVDTINKTFYCSSSNQSISYDLAKSGLDTGTYRSVADFTVTLKDGRVEKFTRYSAEVKVP